MVVMVRREQMKIEIPDNSTNGEVIKALFDCKLEDELCYSYLWRIGNNGYYSQFEKNWWHTPYNENKE